MKVALVGNWLEIPRIVFETRGHEVHCIAPGLNTRDSIYPCGTGAPFDFMLAFPPCRYLCSSGLHWNKRDPDRALLTDDSVEFVRQLLDAPIPRICVENPVGCLSTRIRKPDQMIQPYEYGHDASKKTCLWLKGLQHLRPTKHIAPRMVGPDVRHKIALPRWGNQFDSGQNNQVNAVNRTEARAERWLGVMEAMCDQWLGVARPVGITPEGRIV